MSIEHPGAGLDADELETWSALATLLEWLPATLDAQLQRDAAISHFEFGIMFALSRADDASLRMSTLAGYANSTLSRLSRAVSRLEARGWVQRASEPDDRRYTLATLTPAGRQAVTDATPGHSDLVRRLVFDALTPRQARQLRVVSRRITSAIRQAEGWRPPA